MADNDSYTSKIIFEGDVKANTIQVAGRDMFVESEKGFGYLDDIRDGLASAKLPRKRRKQAFKELEAAEEEANKGKPDYASIGDRIKSLRRILEESGALASAGQGMIHALKQLAALAS
jgi:hypothetical protein